MGQDDTGERQAYIICAVYLTLALSIVVRGGYHAQDFDYHLSLLRQTVSGRWQLPGATNPSLLYLYAAGFVKIFGTDRALPIISASFAALNAAALVLLWRCLRRLLSAFTSTVVLGLIATLPAFVTMSVTFAADSLALVLFVVFCYLNIRLLESPRPVPRLLLASAAVQMTAGFTKYSFIGAAPAAFVIATALAYRWRARPAVSLAAIAVVFAIPTAANYFVMQRLHGGDAHKIQWLEPTGTMSVRSLVWPYQRDLYLLSAPSYFEPIAAGGRQIAVDALGRPDPGGRPGFALLVNNRYSYPSLMNLALNSDILNVSRRRFHGANTYGEAGTFRPLNQRFQQTSVILGAVLEILLLVSLAAVTAGAIRAQTLRHLPSPSFVVGAFMPGVVFTAMIIGMLPFVGYETYYSGYWVPRFTLPGLLMIGIAGAWALTKTVRTPFLRRAILALAVVKIAVQIALLF